MQNSSQGSKCGLRCARRYRWVTLLVLPLLLLGGVTAWVALRYGRAYWTSNTAFDEASRIVLIKPGTPFDSVAVQLQQEGVIRDARQFKRFCKVRNFDQKRYGGRYEVRRGTTTRALANMIASHRQAAVRLVVPSVRTREEMAGRLAHQLWLDSSVLAEALWDSTLAARYGFTVEEFPAMVVPNTYEVYWDVTLERLFDRLHREWEAFWTPGRRERLERTGLTEAEATTLASIVQEEVRYKDEMPRVAGVYINRLRADMPLQACPTIKYALGDFTLQRILFVHTQVESPYNTYIHLGLPPGPIAFPEITAVDAVLNYETHDYLYFCAKDDFSGRHNFSRTGEQHMRYARQYQRTLNRRGIGL